MLRALIVIPVLTIGVTLPAHAQQTTGQQDVRQEIEDFNKKYDETFNKHDAAGMAALFTEDAIVMRPASPLTGRAEIEDMYQGAFKAGYSNHLTTVLHIEDLGDGKAWAVGQFSAKGQGANNTIQEVHGNWGTVDERVGGEWKIRMSAWNFITPAPAEATGSSASSPTPTGNK